VARQKNRLPSEEITISTNPQIVSYLRELVDSGFFGHNEAEAAERLIAKTLERLVEEGKLERRPRGEQPQT
jgi:Arc/MetJ-type ribon-helix-helix transcriptional regulator